MTNQSPGYHLRKWLAQLQAQRKIFPGEYPLNYGGIPLKTLERTYGERILIAGDAAGQVKPTSGGGIYFGLICADIASRTLHNALSINDLSSNMLLKYETDWRKVLARELKKEYLARRFYQTMNNKQIDLVISILKKSGIVDKLLQDPDLSFDWHGGILLKALKLAIGSGANHILKNPFKSASS